MSVIQAAHLFRQADSAAEQHYTIVTRTLEAVADYERVSDDYRADLWAFVRTAVCLVSVAAGIGWLLLVGKALLWIIGKVV